ncbi:MAG TPA: S53 family peptidase [Gemmataceae bacterium]|nr:S53 family peptidase [Gemmataceae bacterium]
MSAARPPSWLRRLSQALRPGKKLRPARPVLLALEGLESRLVPAGGVAVPLYVLGPAQTSSSANSAQPDSTYQSGGGFTPLGIQTAYGVSLLPSGDDGTGQTIAVIDAYDDPKFLDSTDPNFAGSDLAQFDAEFGLPNPAFEKVSQTGSTTNLPGTDPAGAGNDNWEIEEALDVEYAHVMAPAANILLVECNSDSFSDLFAGADWAAASTAKGGGGATVVSMSFGQDGGFSSETAYDGDFSPAACPDVTFLAAAGDNGPVSPRRRGTGQADYPADSPNVVAVGGTNLQADPTTGAYISETVWNELSVGAGATGGGVSNFESQPSYQATAAAGISATRRVAPDVAFDADPYSGVLIYDSYNGAVTGDDVYAIGGTSVSTPLMGGVVAVADQIRAADGMSSLTGATQTLPILYGLYNTSHYSQDFHDVTSGSVGAYTAGVGYDALSGLGAPIVSNLAPDLATARSPSPVRTAPRSR